MPPIFPLHFQEAVLRILSKTFFLTFTGLSPCIVSLSRELQIRKKAKRKSMHHISFILLQRIQFELHRFRSLLLTASRLISFPAGTKTLQFPAFPDLEGLYEKTHSEISGSKLTFNSPEHIVACHVLHRRPEPSHPSNSVQRTIYWLLKMCLSPYGSSIWQRMILFSTKSNSYLTYSRQELQFLKAHYVPITRFSWGFQEHFLDTGMDPSGFEPETSCLQGRRSTPELRAQR